MPPKKTESKVEMLRSDPATYRAMCTPFATNDEATLAIRSFFEEVGELRKKHKLADVHIIVSGNVVKDDGHEGQFILNGHWGDTERGEAMTAWAFGREQTERQQRTHELLSAHDAIRQMTSERGKR